MKLLTSHLTRILLTLSVCLTLLTCTDEDVDTYSSPQVNQLGFTKEDPLIIGIDENYAPLEYINEKGEPNGYDVEFTKILMKRLGLPYTYRANTWDNISTDVLHGKVDLGMMIYSPYRKDSTNYSRAVFRLYYQVVYPKNSSDERFDFRNLKGKRIAYMKSRPVGEMLGNENAIKFSVTDLEEAMFNLVNGKYDAVICYRFQAKYLINRHHFDNLLTDDISLPPREYCYVSHSKALINIIDKELLKMEKEGITDDVYVIKSTFNGLHIPSWIWYLLGTVAFVLLAIINIIYRKSRKQLAQANAVLERSNEELKERNEELIVARERAMESDRMKTAFIQNMTHQIRTPLNIVTGFAQVINEEYDTLSKEEIKMMSSQMMKSTDALTAIVNKLIALSILQSKRKIEKKDHLSCNAICREAIQQTTLSHPDTVTLQLDTTVPDSLLLLTNKIVINRVLHELLSNADQFTQQGSITLSCYQPDEHSVCFCVTDTGSGIPEKDRTQVFNLFYKPDEFAEGLGLGLSLCRRAISQLGGTIRIDEAYTTGTRIILTLPLAES